MGPQTQGGIARHLEALRQAVLEWLDYEDKLNKPNPSLVERAELEAEDPPRQPEALTLLREARRFGVSVLTGDIDSWPLTARREYNTVMDAEDEHKRIRARNAALQAEYDAKKAKQTLQS